ncbi:MAG: condensation domain-containing protein, partial [Steroidobacteraceae bacterium]
MLAAVWKDLLRAERVGRNDNFFELGGDSILMLQMMERLRRNALSVEVRSVYESPTLAALAGTLAAAAANEFAPPPNLIPPGCAAIRPEMLSLVVLDQEQIDRIVRTVPGGAANVQDIYPLAPLQEGILFHHLLNDRGGDTYVLPMLLSLSSQVELEQLVRALQYVMDRHDALRTAVLWEQLPRPVQVVYRRATLPVEKLTLAADRDPAQQLMERMRPDRLRLDLRRAPMLRLQIAEDANGMQHYALLQLHHLASDHDSLEAMIAEIGACIDGRTAPLPEPLPYRNHVAQALAYARDSDAKAFFSSRLKDVDEATAPFGLTDVRGDGSRIEEAHEVLDATLALRIRAQARAAKVSAATLFHVAWALVVSCTTGRDDVVFGTVLLGRLQGNAGTQRILGMFMNTLPLRLCLHGISVEQLVQQTQHELAELLNHEHASLKVAQQCSGVTGSTPLFAALLNYRHSALDLDSDRPTVALGVRVLASREWTNYPITFSVDDHGESFVLTAKTDRCIEPCRVIGYVSEAMRSLIDSLEKAPQTLVLTLPVLPQSERRQVIESFNATQAAYPPGRLAHELFEDQVQRTPDAVAVACEGRTLTYAELNDRANGWAQRLQDNGVAPDQIVGICIERSLEMVVGLLAILKAGGAYLPLDPRYPTERLAYMLTDAAPKVLLTLPQLQA